MRVRDGQVKPVRSCNPLVMVVHEWIALLRDLRHATSVRDVVTSLFGQAGAQSQLPPQDPPPIRPTPLRRVPSRMLRGAVGAALCLIGGAVAFAQGDTSQSSKAASARAQITARFAAADIDHDGKLTRDEAKAGMPMVSRNFDEIDQGHKGYVTLDDIAAYARQRTQQRSGNSDAAH